MPRYDYRCKSCEHRFEAQHSMNDDAPPCPECGSDVQRLITSVPTIARGIMTHAGDGKVASKEQLRAKWAEETPKLRKKLVDKLGEDVVNHHGSTLNTSYDD